MSCICETKTCDGLYDIDVMIKESRKRGINVDLEKLALKRDILKMRINYVKGIIDNFALIDKEYHIN